MNDIRMVIPRRVESDVAEDHYGKFIISPLERGYGHTLGNALKRMLLSGLTGATVTAIRVNGGLQVFDKIPGMMETVAQLVLQVKQLTPKIVERDNKPLTLTINHDKGGSVYARDIQCPPSVRILNPDLYLFTTDGSGPGVSLELIVERGEGYREADEQAFDDGFIALDANFSPVERVVFDVDAARVRQRTNYDKLVIEIWTDGTIHPQKALSESSITLIRYLQPFDPESDILKDPEPFLQPDPEPEPEVNPLYDVPIEVLDLSTRVFNSLRRTGITSVGDVIDMLERGEDAMLAIRNFGQTSLDELKEKLIENNFMEPDDE